MSSRRSYTPTQAHGFLATEGFCEVHKPEDAMAESEQRGYPRFSWRILEDRIQKFAPALRDILDGVTPSFYRTQIQSAVASRRNPKYRGMEKATAAVLVDRTSCKLTF